MAITVQDPNQDKEVQPGQTSSRPGPPNAQQQGTGYTNIQQIAKANSGNRLNQAVGGGVQQVGQQAQQAIGQSKSDFNQAVQSSNPYLNDTNKTQGQIQGVLADPTKASDADVDQFSQYRSGQYGGPSSLANYDALQQQAQSAQQVGQNLGSAGGRIALLQRFAAKPTQTYSAGQSRLDSALLASGPQKDLQEAQRSTRGLTSQVDTANQGAASQAQDYQARAKSLADYTNQQIQGSENPELDALTKKAQDSTQDVNNVLSDFKAGKASDDELRRVGLGDLIGQNSLGVDLSSYINPSNASAATRLGVADSPAQVAKLQALAKLGGQTDLANEFKDTSQAGSYLKNQFGGADQALAKYNEAKTNYTNLNNNQNGLTDLAYANVMNSITGPIMNSMNVGNPSQSLTQLKQLVNPGLIDSYIKGSPETQKQIREGALSDNYLNSIGLNGKVRDMISGQLDKAAQQYQANKQALSKYAGGYRYGGAAPQASGSSNPAAQI